MKKIFKKIIILGGTPKDNKKKIFVQTRKTFPYIIHFPTPHSDSVIRFLTSDLQIQIILFFYFYISLSDLKTVSKISQQPPGQEKF